MNLTLYKYLSERNKVDKFNDLVFVMTATGSFKADVNILSPTLILSLPIEAIEYLTDENLNEIDDVVLTDGSGKVLDFNYMYIEEFRRYYYVTSIVVSSNELVVVTGDVDPLYSFRDQIIENYGMVDRNEFEYDELLTDDLLPLRNEHNVVEYVPNSGEAVNVSFDPSLYFDSLNVAITTICKKIDTATMVNPPDGSNLPMIRPRTFSSDIQTYVISSDEAIQALSYLFGSRSTWIDSIMSVIAYPFVLDHGGARTDMAFGYDADGNLRYLPLGGNVNFKGYPIEQFMDYKVIADFNLPSPDDFTDLEPYAKYELYIPFVGWVDFDRSILWNNRILVYYAINMIDGSATAYVYDAGNNKVVYSSTCQIGLKLSVSKSNQEEITTQKNANALNLAISLLGSALSIGAGVATSNPMLIAGGALGAVGSVAGAINKDAMLFKHSSTTFGDPATALYAPMQVKLRINKVQVVDGLNMVRYAHQFGRPLRLVKKLKDLSGFTKLSSIHLEGVTATDVEKTSIESSLLGGVIL